ncbi:MAG: hypothetical protein AAGJ79_10055, partial [Verrucomicrobiota bacterium]
MSLIIDDFSATYQVGTIEAEGSLPLDEDTVTGQSAILGATRFARLLNQSASALTSSSISGGTMNLNVNFGTDAELILSYGSVPGKPVPLNRTGLGGNPAFELAFGLVGTGFELEMIVSSGSFTATTGKLGVSQPNLSISLAEFTPLPGFEPSMIDRID